MIDAARRPTDSIHPVYFPRIFRRFLEAAANVRRYLICARPPAVPAGWMIDHPGILTQTARLRQSSFPPIRLMTKARMKRASLFLFEELGATEREREETKETDRPDVFINFYGCVLAGEAICAIRGVEGRREGAALLARLKPLLSPSLPAWHFGKGRNLGPPAGRAARYYPGRGWESVPPSEGICNGYTRRTTNTTFAIPPQRESILDDFSARSICCSIRGAS